jgi:lipopolysaccharide/colanic/teichoic acid biosynthesis glycosyltransferase
MRRNSVAICMTVSDILIRVRSVKTVKRPFPTSYKESQSAEFGHDAMIELIPKLRKSEAVKTVVGDSRTVPQSWEASKRAMDIVLASIGLILTLPLLLLALIAIVVSSPGNPFFAQQRIGRFGKPFTIFKLRTMVHDAERHDNLVLKKQRSDDRIIPAGRLLRKLSLDEIPNLVNVLRGEMSIVGPRPMLSRENIHCLERHGHRATAQRLSTRPGLTGLWQISGRGELHFDERVELDVRYAMTWTPTGDVAIIMKTVPVLLFGHGAF